MSKEEGIKKIDLCEDCQEKKAEYLYIFRKFNIFGFSRRLYLLCKNCIKKDRYNQINMFNIK